MPVEIFGETPTKVPELFQAFIDKIRASKDIDTNEYLFAAVLYNVFEMGFVLCNPKFGNHVRIDFDLPVLTEMLSLPIRNIYRYLPYGNYFESTVRLGPDRNPEVTLIGQPSVSSETKYLTVHFFLKEPKCLVSHCFQPSNFVRITDDHQFQTRSLDVLARTIKDNVVLPVKQPLLLHSFEQCVPHLLGLPDHVFNKIMSYLPPTTRARFEVVARRM